MRTVDTIAAATAVLLSAVATPTEAKMLSCSIEASREGESLRLVAYAFSDLSGEVHSDLAVVKSGPAGTSRNRQGGTYAVKAGGRTVVGEVTIGATRSDTVKATLDVDTDTGTARCSYPEG